MKLTHQLCSILVISTISLQGMHNAPITKLQRSQKSYNLAELRNPPVPTLEQKSEKALPEPHRNISLLGDIQEDDNETLFQPLPIKSWPCLAGLRKHQHHQEDPVRDEPLTPLQLHAGRNRFDAAQSRVQKVLEKALVSPLPSSHERSIDRPSQDLWKKQSRMNKKDPYLLPKQRSSRQDS